MMRGWWVCIDVLGLVCVDVEDVKGVGGTFEVERFLFELGGL